MQVRRILFGLLAAVLMLTVLASSMAGTRTVAGSRYRAARLMDIPILNYHKVDDFSHELSLSPAEFDEQMSYLYDNGYNTISPDDLTAYLKYGKALPEKPVLITFDDGYLDNYTNAYPIMKKYGFRGTIFLVTGMVGQDERFVTWEQVRQMQKNGWMFGSHTAGHVALTELTPQQALAELTESSRDLERELGIKSGYFAYPTGAYNKEVIKLVRQAGYRAAFTIRYGQAGVESDPYAVERIPLFKSSRTFRSFYYRLTAAPVLERLGFIR